MSNRCCLSVLGVVLFVWGLASSALASPPADLRRVAPFARALVKARWQGEGDGKLIFAVERVFAGPLVDEIEVSAWHWREAWGRPAQGFAAFFVYSNNSSVDMVFPVVEGRVRVFFPGTVLYLDRPPEWARLDEVEAQLALIAARREELELSLRAGLGGTLSTVFRNAADHPLFVNLEATYRFLVRDSTTGKILRSVPQVPNPWDCTARIRRLHPGEEITRPVPAEVLEGLGQGHFRLSLQYTSEGGCRRKTKAVTPGEAAVWRGRRDAELDRLQESP